MVLAQRTQGGPGAQGSSGALAQGTQGRRSTRVPLVPHGVSWGLPGPPGSPWVPPGSPWSAFGGIPPRIQSANLGVSQGTSKVLTKYLQSTYKVLPGFGGVPKYFQSTSRFWGVSQSTYKVLPKYFPVLGGQPKYFQSTSKVLPKYFPILGGQQKYLQKYFQSTS